MNEFLGSKSWREAIFYAYQLKDMFDIDSRELINSADNLRQADDFLRRDISSLSTEDIKKALVSVSHKSAFNAPDAELISFLQNTFNEKKQLNNDDFKWIKDDPRICSFCYYFVKLHTFRPPLEEDVEEIKCSRSPFEYQDEARVLNNILYRENSMMLCRSHTRKVEPNSHRNRFKIVESAFLYSEINLSGQRDIMSLLTEAWTKSLKEETNIKFSKWLNAKDNHMVTWLCDYTKKQENMFYLPWEPINDEERYLALQAEFDYEFLANPKENKYLFMQARLAWNQMTARNKKNGSKSRGISMSERTSKRLDWLVANKDEKINTVIKKLIDDEYEHLGGPS